jgi:hypothetical protein
VLARDGGNVGAAQPDLVELTIAVGIEFAVQLAPLPPRSAGRIRYSRAVARQRRSAG